jgi:hypothetical protein
MHFNGGFIERTVRFLIGLPMATAYAYVRHFDMSWAYGLLVMGGAVMATSFFGENPESEHQKRASRKGGIVVPSLLFSQEARVKLMTQSNQLDAALRARSEGTLPAAKRSCFQ